jgi:hypothetical protein
MNSCRYKMFSKDDLTGKKINQTHYTGVYLSVSTLKKYNIFKESRSDLITHGE